MRYLCLVYVDESRFAELTPEEAEAIDDASMAHDEKLRRNGQLVLAQALESIDEAVSVRVRDGKMSTTDGPFAETKEQLGGFVFVEARDLNEAIRIAADVPLARLGTIEVRPVMDLERRIRERPPR